jgi:hypothetical protein
MQRKMVKWKPFNTLLKYKDILDIERNRSLIDKPVIMEDRIIKIDNLLKDVNENTLVKVKYFNKGVLFYITGNIKNVNEIEKYILINNTRIYYKNLIDIEII